MRTCYIYEEYEDRLDSLQYKYRKEILERVMHYLLIIGADSYAIRLVDYRIRYNHHYVEGF